MSAQQGRQISTTLETVQQELNRLVVTLPPGIKKDRFIATGLAAIRNNPKLLECEPASLFDAFVKAATDGLIPDGREGVITPRWRKQKDGPTKLLAHWMPMVAGIIKKAKIRGSVASLVANVVYRGEPYRFLMGDDERIVHERLPECVGKGKEVAVYAIAVLKDGTKEREALTWSQVQDIRTKSEGGGKYGPWAEWEDEMGRKSVLRRLSKRLPSLDDGDDELHQVVGRVDELYDFGSDNSKQVLSSPRAQVISHDDTPPPVDLQSRRPVAEEVARAENIITNGSGPTRSQQSHTVPVDNAPDDHAVPEDVPDVSALEKGAGTWIEEFSKVKGEPRLTVLEEGVIRLLDALSEAGLHKLRGDVAKAMTDARRRILPPTDPAAPLEASLPPVAAEVGK